MGENEEPMALLGAIGGTEGIMWGRIRWTNGVVRGQVWAANYLT